MLANPNKELFFICGPCSMEGEQFAIDTAGHLKEVFSKYGARFIYKSSFDKANRSSGGSYRGMGLDQGLKVLQKVRAQVGVEVITDVHEAYQAEPVASVVDYLQTPAFLCRQTDFILEVAKQGKPVNIKKGQFLSPWEMKGVLDKARSTGNNDIWACERGFSFGYNNLIVDMRSFMIMREFGAPLVFDATHSVQLPGGQGGSSGGQRQFVAGLARAAVACGVDGVFLESHPDPDSAPCDGPNMVPFADLERLIEQLLQIHSVTKA